MTGPAHLSSPTPESESATLPARGSRQRPQWYVRSVETLHRSRPFLIPAVAGMFFLEVGEILPAHWSGASLATIWTGQALLVFAVARRLHMAGWVRKRRVVRVGLWIANAAVSATLAVFAFGQYVSSRDPNTWFLVESHPIGASRVLEDMPRPFYLLDAAPQVEWTLEIVKKDEYSQPGAMQTRLQRQAQLSEQNEENSLRSYVIHSRFTNVGAKPLLSVRLPLRVSYEGLWRKDLPVPPPRTTLIPIERLNPGESFDIVIFSTDGERYSTLVFPDNVWVKLRGNPLFQTLKVNYQGDETDRNMSRYVVITGVHVATSAGQ